MFPRSTPFDTLVLHGLFRLESLSFFAAFGMNTVDLLLAYLTRCCSGRMGGGVYKLDSGKRALTALTTDSLLFVW